MTHAARASATPEPFWQRLPSIALYPLQPAVLITLVALTLALLLRVIPFIGFLVTCVTWLAAYKYAFEILRRTADGYMEAPEVELSVDDGMVWRFFGMQLVLGVVLVACVGFGGLKVGLVALVAMAFLQPGMTMTLAMTDSLGAALNPMTALSLVGRIGWPYLAVFALLLVIQMSALTAGSWVAGALPILGPLVLAFCVFWAMFSAFHLMGYLIYQSHEALGFAPAALNDQTPVFGAPGGDALLEQAEPLVREGRVQDALALLRGEIRTRAVTPAVHDLYRRLLKQSGDQAAVLEHGRQYLHQLMLEKQDRRALGLLRESLDADPRFVPMFVEHGERLAEQARLGGQSQLALDAYQAMLQAFPTDPGAPRWALQAAMLLVDRFGRDSDAIALLVSARARCEDPAMLEKFDAALKALGHVAT